MVLLWLIPLLPLAGFLLLVAGGGRWPRPAVAAIGAGSVGVAALLAVPVTLEFLAMGPGASYSQILWVWFDVGGLRPDITLYLDGLSLVMLWIITGVGFLIHVYATGYMAGEAGYGRFFAYMNLFVFAMLMLVLADDLLVLYLGWEGVGLCSYLLIGFFHHDPANGYAARKAFIITRIGDTALVVALFLLFRELGTLDIQRLLAAAPDVWSPGATTVTVVALLLLGGAVGKSAQLPLQTWLPDAMAGPTPVSALIHAATMVTAGVYLIARLHDLYLLAPLAQTAVALVGLATLLLAAFSALAQHDIKRVLAYSTMSQIGYMFFALGVGAWSAAIFHLMTHAFFKALLFLSAGSVILALHHQQDMRRMGGLWRRLPLPFAAMLAGTAALAALPLTSGFFSKDAILLTSAEAVGGGGLWFGASVGAFVTALYGTRLILLTFFGELREEPADESGLTMKVPLVLLSLLAIGGGWFGLAPVGAVLPDGGLPEAHGGWLPWLTAAVPLAGVLAGWLLFRPQRRPRVAAPSAAARLGASGGGFDYVYARAFERPFVAGARYNRHDVLDGLFEGLAGAVQQGHRWTAALQSGRLRWYLANMAGGLVVLLLIVLGAL